MATTSLPPGERLRRGRALDARPVRVGAWWAGITLGAGVLAIALAYASMRPSANHLVDLAVALGEVGALTLALGLVALDLARLRVMRRVWLKLALPPVVAALIVAFTSTLLARDMFISLADSQLLLVFLVFAVALALALAGTLATGLGREIARLETGARRIAEGDYAHRVPLSMGAGATLELGRLGEWLNLMAARVQESFARREATEAERKHLVAALSHDLRTPVTSLRAMLEAIGDGVVRDPETIARYHRAMRAETLRLSLLMDELFEMARLDAGGIVLQRERLGIEDLISDALEAFHEPAMRGGITLAGRVACDLPLAELDPRHFSRALANLLQNALRYTPRGGVVLVRARLSRAEDGLPGRALVVEVEDSGAGIPAGELARIFERGYRGTAARDRTVAGIAGADTPGMDGGTSLDALGPGAGLGLAIMRAIVELHGGWVWAVSPVPPMCWSELAAQLAPMADSADAISGGEPRGTLVGLALPLGRSALSDAA